MNGQPVDVLAVMDHAAHLLGVGVESNDPMRESVEALHEARAAVSELKEQAQRCCDGVGDIKDLRASLARISGAQS